MSRFVEVPYRMLPGETLDALLEAFVTRQGYDTTDTGEGMRGWAAELKGQLERGELVGLAAVSGLGCGARGGGVRVD